MRFSISASSAASRLTTLALVLSTATLVRSKPAKPAFIPANLHLIEGSDAIDSGRATVLARAACANPCGYGGWLCCSGAGQCYTDSGMQAQCGAGAATAASPQATGGYWQYYTTTWVETESATKTAVYSTWVGAPAATPTAASCAIPCGSNCCSSGQYCLIWSSGTCAAAGTTPGAGATASAPLRPTSSGVVVVTATVKPTTTVPFQSAVPTGQNVTMSAGASHGLSGGAIAGIVIGVLAAIILLILICLFCCARALFDSVLAILGIGKKRHTHEETYIEEHHHSSGAAGGRWYGHDRPSRPARPEKKSKFGGMAGVGAALGGLALVLGLKRKHDRKHDEKSDYGSTYYSSDYTSSSSASSSDRHTRRTRDSRVTRDTRRSSRH